MTSKRLFFVLIGLNCLLVAAIIGAAYGVNILLTNQSQNLVKQRLQVQTLDSENAALGKAKQDVAQYSSLAAIAGSIVPQDKDQAQTVREIVNIAANNGIKLGSITFPSSTLGTVSNTGSPISQLIQVPGISGVYSLEIVVQSDGTNPVPYSQLVSFLQALESNRRTALVSSITLTPDSKNPNTLTFSLTLDEYIKP